MKYGIRGDRPRITYSLHRFEYVSIFATTASARLSYVVAFLSFSRICAPLALLVLSLLLICICNCERNLMYSASCSREYQIGSDWYVISGMSITYSTTMPLGRPTNWIYCSGSICVRCWIKRMLFKADQFSISRVLLKGMCWRYKRRKRKSAKIR